MGIRLDKVSNLIKEELSLIFLHKIQDTSLGLVTITKVKLTPDIKLARIYISTFDKENREAVLKKIGDLKGMIRSELARKVHLKFIPDLEFFIDDTQDYVEKIEGLFKQIHENDNEERSEQE